MKKIIMLLLTCVLSLVMINNIKADSTGSITISGTTVGKTYEIYKIFDLTYSGNKVAYTIDSDWMDFFETEGEEYITLSNSGSLNQITVGSETKYINITEDNIEEFTKKALEYATTLEGNDGSSIAESETLTFSDLELGYYLVYPQGATDMISNNGSICSITSTTPDATVEIKADYPTIEKDADEKNVEVGQLVEFIITSQVPDTTGFTSYTYEIKDAMSAGLLLDSQIASMVVKFGNTIIKDVTPEYLDNGFTLTFDMTDYQEYVGSAITVTYFAKITEEAVNSSATKNSATLTYSNDPKDLTKTTTTPPVEVLVYSSEINVTKVDANDNEVKLAGASFVIKNQEGLYYQAIGENEIITELTTTEGIIDVKWVESLEEATVLTTDDDGIITFKGVKNGTYYLEEIKAPEGYNRLTGVVELKVGYTDEEGTNLSTVAVSHQEIVENNSGTVLPNTGGMGTKLFITIGLLLTIVSVCILITNKRISKE